MRRAIPLPSIFEPVSHLGQGQACLLSQILLLLGERILRPHVALLQRVSRTFLEAVNHLLAVPNRLWQWILLPKPILVDGAERTSPDLFRLAVMRLVPHLLQFRVAIRGERMALQDRVELVVSAPMKSHRRPCYQHVLVAAEQLARRQRPQEPNHRNVRFLLDTVSFSFHDLIDDHEDHVGDDDRDREVEILRINYFIER